MPVDVQSRQTQKTQKSQPPLQAPPTAPTQPVEPTVPVRPVTEWPAPEPAPAPASGAAASTVQLALFPPDRVRVRRPRHASTQLVSAAVVPVLAGVGLSGWWVFVLVEALFPAAADGSCPRLVMGVAGLVVLVCGAGLAAAATGAQVGGVGGRR